jgi:tRNA pseudouridine38-40 synthase
MPSYRLLLEYDGTPFVGWQRQAEGASVQGHVEAAVARVMGVPAVSVMASGRTDAGVHAMGQVASFTLPVQRDTTALRRGINSLLPDEICCREAALAPPGFDARLHARGKRYRYRILDGDLRSPLRQRFVAYERSVLDVVAMAQAARFVEGTHDFTSFRAQGSDVPTSVRTIHQVLVERRGDEVIVEVEGDGFLRHMVRIMVGTLLEVGRGRRAPETLEDVIGARARDRADKTAPARGLCLLWVEYDLTEPAIGARDPADDYS